MLTRKQHELLTFICNYIDRNGIAPTYAEMKAAAGLASKSGINRMMHALIERGFIRTIPNLARAIEVLRRPDGQVSHNYLLTAAEQKVVGWLRANPDTFNQIHGAIQSGEALKLWALPPG